VEQPAEDAGFASKVRIASYPTVEYLGLIFAYLGEGEPPPAPRFPDFETEGVLETEGYVRHCNYFQNIENGPDEVHLAFVHHETHGLPVVPRVDVEETDYGLVQYGTRPNQPVRVTHIQMPNILRIRTPSREPEESGWRNYVSWRVPRDDTSHYSFVAHQIQLTGEAADRYRARAAVPDPSVPPPSDVATAVLRGEARLDDMKDYPYLLSAQDTVAQVGQGPIADRTRERLGRSDVGVFLIRKLWEQELRALAEGRPLRQWANPESLETTAGV
jgi:5,5'-dehydrodivanillate O-demethylase